MSKNIEVSWRPVVGYEGLYSVSSEGQVRAEEKTVKGNQHQSGRRLKPKAMSLWTHDFGYMMVTLKDQQAKKRHWRVHQLVAIAFLGDPPTAKHEPNHKNRNRADNSVGNLEWVTRSENLAHSWANPMRDRTGNVGPKNGSAKLTEAEAGQYAVPTIKKLVASGLPRLQEIFRTSTTRMSGWWPLGKLGSI